MKRFCERPALVEGNAQRTIDFWVDYGRREVFWMLDSSTGEREVFPAMHGVRVEVIRHEDLVALAARIRNWAAIVPYLTGFRRFSDARLTRDLYGRLAKPHRLEMLKCALAPIEPSAIRAALFTLLASGKLVAPELDRLDLSARTLFRRARA